VQHCTNVTTTYLLTYVLKNCPDDDSNSHPSMNISPPANGSILLLVRSLIATVLRINVKVNVVMIKWLRCTHCIGLCY